MVLGVEEDADGNRSMERALEKKFREYRPTR